jgi:hypothetical protein
MQHSHIVRMRRRHLQRQEVLTHALAKHFGHGVQLTGVSGGESPTRMAGSAHRALGDDGIGDVALRQANCPPRHNIASRANIPPDGGHGHLVLLQTDAFANVHL